MDVSFARCPAPLEGLLWLRPTHDMVLCIVLMRQMKQAPRTTVVEVGMKLESP